MGQGQKLGFIIKRASAYRHTPVNPVLGQILKMGHYIIHHHHYRIRHPYHQHFDTTGSIDAN